MKKGKFIIVEGIDGSGKSTNVPVIKAVLNELNVPAIHTHEPGGTPLGEAIRSMLKNPVIELTPDVQTMLLCTARLDHINRVIRPALKAGITVVCDRFWPSTYAYQHAGMAIDHTDINRLADSFGMNADYLDEDLVLYFDLPISMAKGRLGENSDYFDSKSVEFFQRVIACYDEMAAEIQTFSIIDATQSEEHVAAQVRKQVSKLFQ